MSRFELLGGYQEHEIFLGKGIITSKYFLQFYGRNWNNNVALKRLTDYYYFSSCFTYIIQALEEIVKIKDDIRDSIDSVSYTHLRAHETVLDLVCRLLLEKKNTTTTICTIQKQLEKRDV